MDQLIAAQKQPLPHISLQLSELKIIICFKLRLFKSANEEFARLGDLNDISYQFGSYPSSYDKLSGSFVPFSLRILQAELPSYQGNVTFTIDSLYNLLNMCQDEILNSNELEDKNLDKLTFKMENVDEILGSRCSLPNYLNPLHNSWDPDAHNFNASM